MNEKIDVSVQTLPPFKRFCMTIGELPTAYVDSMSYYEMLLWFTKYLSETVIPTINNNAEATKEVQDMIVELQSYINNYFDNLDVQEEINNKLNSMVISGELSSIIDQDLFSDIRSQILQNSVDIEANTQELATTVKENQTESITMNMLTQEVRTALTGGSTAVVGEDSISQANIQDGAITLFKLDDYLYDTKSISYGAPKDLGERYAGFVTDNDGELSVVTSDSNYAHVRYELTKDKIYAFTGLNYYLGYGIIVADSDDNIVYKSGTAVSNEVQPQSLIFRVNESGLTAYFTIFKNLYDSSSYVGVFARYNTPLLREIDILTNNYKKITPRLIKKMEDYFLGTGHDGYGQPRPYAYSGTNVYIYEIVKGKKYQLHAYDWSSACGIYVLSLDNDIIYQSSSASVGSTYVEANYEFTATVDGYACLFERGTYSPSITIVEDLVSNTSTQTTEKLGFNKWYALGDSLTEVNFRASKNYVGYITDELNITAVNLGHSGSGYMHENSGVTFTSEISGMTNYNYNTDIVTVMGSINDFQHISSLGQLGDTTTDTLYGCIYNFFDTLFTAHIGARVGVILPPPTNTYHSSYSTYTTYNKAITDTALLFSVPVLDLSTKSNLKPWIEAFQTEFFTADGTGNTGQTDQVHPNSKGHWLLHNEIKQFLKSL